MVGFVFGIIILLAGIGVGIGLYLTPHVTYAEDENGRYMYDENKNRILIN